MASVGVKGLNWTMNEWMNDIVVSVIGVATEWSYDVAPALATCR